AAGARGADPRYPDCAAADRAGYGPYFRETRKEYHWYTDKDGDGVACDQGDL
ncbi:excalibur calcium-binding domain-containing protein, partial [Streptosporangium algeriense]